MFADEEGIFFERRRRTPVRSTIIAGRRRPDDDERVTKLVIQAIGLARQTQLVLLSKSSIGARRRFASFAVNCQLM